MNTLPANLQALYDHDLAVFTAKQQSDTQAYAAQRMSFYLSQVNLISIVCAGTMAPAVVHVDALKNGQPDNDRYATHAWDFGDPGSRFNQSPGYAAAHYYRSPGTYTIKLTVTAADGSVQTSQTSVTILPDTRKQVTAKTVNDLIAGLGDNTRITLLANTTYAIPATLMIPFKDLVIQAPSGSTTVFNVVANGSGFGLDAVKTKNFVLDGVQYTSPGPVFSGLIFATGWMGWMQGQNLAVVNCTFQKVMDAIQSNVYANCLLVQDNQQLDPNGIVAHMCWLQGNHVIVLGNIGTGSLSENVFRMADTGVIRGLVYQNSMSRPRTGTDPKSGQPLYDNRKATFTIRTAVDVVFQDNKSQGSWFGLEPRSSDRHVTNCSFLNTQLVDSFFGLKTGVQNCVFHHNNTVQNVSGPAMTVIVGDGDAETWGIECHDNTAHLLVLRPFEVFYTSAPDGKATVNQYRSWNNTVLDIAGHTQIQQVNTSQKP